MLQSRTQTAGSSAAQMRRSHPTSLQAIEMARRKAEEDLKAKEREAALYEQVKDNSFLS